MGKFNSAKQFIGQIFGGKVSPTITKVKPAKNLTTKRTIQDETVKAVDEGIKKADTPQSFKESQKIKQYASETKRKKSKELKDYSYRLDKLREKKAIGGRTIGQSVKKIKKLMDESKAKKQDAARVKKMGGGMMGRRFGMKKGSGKKFPDLTGDGKVTFADILKGRGVINGKKKKK